MTPNRLSRRSFLRGSGVALGLPLLDAMLPTAGAAARAPDVRRRMIAINTGLGIHAPYFFPEQAGRDYKLSPYLAGLEKVRNDFTVFSGVSHPAVDGGHSSAASYLTGAPHPGGGAFHNTISFDQLAVEHIGAQTRFGYLALCTGSTGIS